VQPNNGAITMQTFILAIILFLFLSMTMAFNTMAENYEANRTLFPKAAQ
jgi:hypothetical protein